MPYIKQVICYYPGERQQFHKMGIWIDKSGNQIPVNTMSAQRLAKLCSLLVKWAMQEPEPFRYIANHPLFLHIFLRIREVGLYNIDTEFFTSAYIRR